MSAHIQRLLADHYAASGYAPQNYNGPRPGRWSCGCGAGGVVPVGERVTDHYRAHLAALIDTEIAGALEHAATEVSSWPSAYRADHIVSRQMVRKRLRDLATRYLHGETP